jgi:hypothetical protein
MYDSRPTGRRIGLEDAADNSVIGKHLVVIFVHSPDGRQEQSATANPAHWRRLIIKGKAR